jgi:hypothetical protein
VQASRDELLQAPAEGRRAAVRRVAHVLAAERGIGDASDCNQATSACKLARERQARRDLRGGRTAVRPLVAGMRGDRVPKEHVVRDSELGEDAMDDRRRRLSRTYPCELALGGEWDTGHSRATVPGRLPDDQEARPRALVQIPLETVA